MKVTPTLHEKYLQDSDHSFKNLTVCEIQVAKELADGLCVKEIAQKYNLSVHTIDTHKNNLFQKLDVHNIATLTRRWIYEIELASPTSQLHAGSKNKTSSDAPKSS